MTATARVTGGGIGRQRFSKAPPSPQHIKKKKKTQRGGGRGGREFREDGRT